MFKWIWNTFLDLVYPRPEECPLCGRSWSIGRYPGAVVCFRCVERLGARRTQSICECCGRYEAENHGAFSQRPRPELAFYCRECQNHPPLFSRARAIGLYEGLLREAIHAFKYQGKITLARPLGKLLAGVIKEEL
ncbi:MAG: hypothetical protein GX295_07025 [Syntrophomonadaceae bacterium]|nr:hypothetical protein [Syntrophomonadaceae bacterium]